MSRERIPAVERPIVLDDPILDFQTSLRGLGFTAFEHPVVNLLMAKEVGSVPDHLRGQVGETVTQVAEEQASHIPITMTVTRAVLSSFPHRGTTMRIVNLMLVPHMVVQGERGDLLRPLDEAGIDTTQGPFSQYRLRATVAKARGSLPLGNNSERVLGILAEEYPETITLGSPQLKY